MIKSKHNSELVAVGGQNGSRVTQTVALQTDRNRGAEINTNQLQNVARPLGMAKQAQRAKMYMYYTKNYS